MAAAGVSGPQCASPLNDPDGGEIKTLIRNLRTKYDSPLSDVDLTKEVIRNTLNQKNASDERLRTVLQCLFRHFVSWNLLNAQIYMCGDCILTHIANCFPRLVIPFLKLDPPEGYERPNANALGEYNLPAIAWAAGHSANSLLTTTVFNYLIQRTSDAALRLCFVSKNVIPLLHKLLNAWRYAASLGMDGEACHRNFSGSVQLLLTRADDDGGGGVDLRVKHNNQTASEFMSSSEFMHMTFKADIFKADIWRQTTDLLDAATKRRVEYADKLLPTLSVALGNLLAGIQPLHALVASYSPALYSSASASASTMIKSP